MLEACAKIIGRARKACPFEDEFMPQYCNQPRETHEPGAQLDASLVDASLFPLPLDHAFEE